MWISGIEIARYKGFQQPPKIEFSKGINILIGKNNSGKSSIINCLYALQSNSISSNDIRLNNSPLEILVSIDEIPLTILQPQFNYDHIYKNFQPKIRITLEKNQQNNDLGIKLYLMAVNGANVKALDQFRPIEPDNYIYPFLSKRKVGAFQEQVNETITNRVDSTYSNLYQKIDRLANPEIPAHNEFIKACDEIIGFRVSSIASQGGKKAVYMIDNFKNIPIDQMGEGVVNMLGLIVNLCLAEDKLFLIEELENDIHPQALKKLLELIIVKSQNNQFVISTHSNIVAKYLGSSENAKIFHLTNEFHGRMPTSKVQEVGNTPEERLKVLEDLGYDSFDFELWKGYLILEESSAEKIIRDILIPWFVPGLKSKLKTIAAKGIDDVAVKFNDFHRLFLYVHTANIYKDKAWVWVDGDEIGKETIKQLQGSYSSWPNEHFQTLLNDNFEKYYPDEFKDEVDKVLALGHNEKKRAKKELLETVLNWSLENKDEAKKAFAISAKEVIDKLKEIAKKLS